MSDNTDFESFSAAVISRRFDVVLGGLTRTGRR
jgi:hypothetical protein